MRISDWSSDVCSSDLSIFHCWKRQGHGRLSMVEAIAQSCDVYFYDLALRGGVDSIADMARRLGFGETFALGLPGARPGLVPTEAWKRATLGRPCPKGETGITGIGDRESAVSGKRV